MFEVIRDLPSPEEFKKEIPLPTDLQKIKDERDNLIKEIFSDKSDKFLLIVGPCSANDIDAVSEYMIKLAKVQEKVKDKILIVPRVYTNKPRTNGTGYKGMMHQPDPLKKPDIKKGISEIRKMHIRVINESHLTAADEMLYPENFPYLDDLLTYHSIGARSVENQLHRLVSSGVDAPVGMKNPTSGDLNVMFNAIFAAQIGHTFLYRQQEVHTNGNEFAHAIMRGSVNKHGENISNYHYEDLNKAAELYAEHDLKNPAIIIDLNHSNSGKKFKEQIRIAKEIIHSKNNNITLQKIIKGLMIESFLVEGNQSVDDGVYGKSITDPCLGFEDTENLIYYVADNIK